MKKFSFSVLFISVILTVFSQQLPNPDILGFYNEKNLWGVIDLSGNTIIPFEYGNPLQFSEGLAPARKIRYIKDKNEKLHPDSLSGLFGYINPKGEWVIPPKFEYAESFEGGIAKVWNQKKQSLIDKNGHLIPFSQYYTDTEQIEEGLFMVTTTSERVGIVSEKGEIILDSVYHRITPDPIHRVFRALKEHEIGVFNYSGKCIVPLGKYDDINPFLNGYSTVSLREGYFEGLIDTSGKVYFFKSFPEGGHLKSVFFSEEPELYVSDGLLVINLYKRNKDEPEGTYSSVNSYEGYCNMKGEIVIDNPKFERCAAFFNGRAIVKTKKDHFHSFVINKRGDIIGGPYLDYRGSFKNGGCWVEEKGEWQYVDTNFRPLFKETFSDVHKDGFTNGKCWVKTHAKNWVWIDTTGNIIPQNETLNKSVTIIQETDGSEQNSTNDFLTEEVSEGKFGLKDKEGNILAPFVYERIMETRYPEVFLAFRNDTTGYINTQNRWIYRTLKTPEGVFPANLDYMLRGFFYARSSQPEKEDGIGGYAHYRPGELADGNPAKLPSELIFPNKKLTVEARKDTENKEIIHLFVVNLTGSEIHFPAQDSRLEMTIEASTGNGYWEEIMYLPSSWCGNSYHTLQLDSGEFWKFSVPNIEGCMPATFRVKIKVDSKRAWITEKIEGTESGESQYFYSNEWGGSINPAQFWRQRGYTPSGIMDPYND